MVEVLLIVPLSAHSLRVEEPLSVKRVSG